MATNTFESSPPQTSNASEPFPFSDSPSLDGKNTQRESHSHENEEKMIFAWSASSRPYKKRDREFYTTIAIIVGLVSLILFFAGQFLFIAVVVSLAFVAYVLNTVPPENVQNALTTFGVRTGDQIFYWEELGRFWFTEKYGTPMVHIETARAFPGVLILLTRKEDQELLKKHILKYLVFEKPKDTWLDKAATWLQEKFPLEKGDTTDKN